jgi:hypothetical protein
LSLLIDLAFPYSSQNDYDRFGLTGDKLTARVKEILDVAFVLHIAHCILGWLSALLRAHLRANVN